MVKDCLSCAVVFLWTLNWKYQKLSDVGLKDLQRDLPLKCFCRLLPIKSGCRVLCLLVGFVVNTGTNRSRGLSDTSFHRHRRTWRVVYFNEYLLFITHPWLSKLNWSFQEGPPFSGNDLFLCTASWNFEVARNFQFMGFDYVLPYFTSW